MTSEITEESVRWVVNDMGELGVEIGGRYFFCYKGGSLEYESGMHDDGSPILVREVGKREFGETVWPDSWNRAGRCEDKYTVEVEYHEGLSDGEPNDPRWQWKPLPAVVDNRPPASNPETAHHAADAHASRGSTYRIGWKGTRTPTQLRFGASGRIAYMRDGILTTTNGIGGTYTRTIEFGGPNKDRHEIELRIPGEVYLGDHLVSPVDGPFYLYG